MKEWYNSNKTIEVKTDVISCPHQKQIGGEKEDKMKEIVQTNYIKPKKE